MEEAVTDQSARIRGRAEKLVRISGPDERLMYLLRYQIGSFAPVVGPPTLFVAARAS